ncbi:hypothetical protein [Spartinivicinus poritis]|uniref:Uncharacterized protein n=1 Tax=Spartinivicinus poritis TaxID=2994640 RepID=A0ABT5UGR5_9GAMM|nr:hypothetical protein [Spartinivicinus sp. A2-2]MDE1464623.1 hypothetical protein [Spartinivicinus sp. A2-2]
MTEISCKFKFECPKKWDELVVTDKDGVRFCSHCKSRVFMANDQKELDEYTANGECVAIEMEYVMLGRPEGVPYVEYSLFIHKQKISGKKLYALRDAILPSSSLFEVSQQFNMKPGKVEDIDEQHAMKLEAELTKLEIKCEIQAKNS